MKRFITSILLGILSCCSVKVMAQWEDAPTMGVFTREELSMTDCAFEKNAPAVILLDRARSYPGTNNELVTDRVVRIKILNDAGLDYANIKIRYYAESDFEHISGIDGVVLTPVEGGGGMDKFTLDKKNIYRSKINAKIGEVTFAMPGVKKGSVIEYRYISTMKHYGGLDDWHFQSFLPTLRSTYHLTLINNSEFAYRVQKSEELNMILKPEPNKGTIYFEMNNVAGLKNEPYMDSRQDFIQKVSFQLAAYGSYMGRSKYMNSWDEVSRELLNHNSFGAQLNKNLDGAKAIITAAALNRTKEEQLSALFNHVRNHFQWNGFYGMYAGGNGVKSAWNSKTGSCGDINLSLVNLLAEAGFEVKPILVAERGYKKVNTSYPFLDQFNKVAAYVTLNNRTYLLDATDGATPFGMLPESLLNTTAFVVDRKKGTLVTLQQPGEGYVNIYNITASLQPDMVASGKGYVVSKGYSALNRMAARVPGEENFIRKVLVKAYTTLKVDSLSLEEKVKPDTVQLTQRFRFATPLEHSGEYFLLNPMPLSGLDKNPFTDEKRFSDINFGATQVFSFNYHLTLNDAVTIESLPRNLRLKLPGNELEFTRRVLREGNIISINFRFEIQLPYYSYQDYDMVKSFYKQMYEYLDEQIVLKKKG